MPVASSSSRGLATSSSARSHVAPLDRQLPSGRHGIDPDDVRLHQVARLRRAALAAVDELGYEAATVSEIIARAGVSRKTFYEETTTTAGAKGQLSVPREFTIAVAPFYGEQRFRVRALLKWRTIDRRLHLGFKLERPEAVLETAIREIEDRLRYGRLLKTTDLETGAVTESRADDGFERVYVGAPATARS